MKGAVLTTPTLQPAHKRAEPALETGSGSVYMAAQRAGQQQQERK